LAGWNKINEESRGNILWSAGVVHTTPDETSIKKYILICHLFYILSRFMKRWIFAKVEKGKNAGV